MGNIFSNKSFTSRYFSAPKSTGPALSPKQKKTFDGADGSKPNNEIEGSEVKAVSQPAKMQEQEGPAKKRSKRLADRSQAAFDKDKVVKAKQTKAIKEGKDKKAKRLSKKRTRLQEKDIKLQRKSFEKASEGK